MDKEELSFVVPMWVMSASFSLKRVTFLRESKAVEEVRREESDTI